MHYKTHEAYTAALETARIFGAGYLFKQKNSYEGQPREERLRYGHKLKSVTAKPAAPVLTDDERTLIAETKSPATLARLIRRHWPKPYFGAVPYLEAMASMQSFDADYGADSGRSIVIYFLANATTWRGEAARLIKARLNAICKES